MLTLTLPRVVVSFIESKPIASVRPPAPVDPVRARVLDEIISLNPSATAAFLDRFATPELRSYLEHLEATQQPRGASARWVRPSGTPGIVVHETRH